MIDKSTASRRPLVLLVLGAATGITLAASGLVARGDAGRSLPAHAVARVNGKLIRSDNYQRVLAALASDRRSGQPPLSESDRRRVLDRLIEEELLVQRGLELGLTHQDQKIRKNLSTAVIDSVVAEFVDLQPSDRELRRFYEQQRDFFAGPGRLHVRQVFCRVPTNADVSIALERARRAAGRLRAGENFDVVRDALGDVEIAPLPDAPLPPGKLVDYLGPTAARTALSLDIGAVSDPVRSSTGYHVLKVIQHQPQPAPPLEEIRPQVIAEFRRRAGEQALRSYLDNLRARAEVEVAATLP